MLVHVAIVVSQRIECLNLFLDILKNNFKNTYVTHVFCNLNEVDMKTYSIYVDYSLIDHFYHFPDDCYMKQKAYDNRSKHKREQPLRLIKKVFDVMSQKTEFDKFIYTECDVYPLSENDYIRYYDKCDSEKMFAYCTFKKSGKCPHGALIPAPVYISNVHAEKLSRVIEVYMAEQALTERSNINFQENSYEGMLMSMIWRSQIKLESISYDCVNNSDFEKNLTLETSTTHQHNILNLCRSLKDAKITSGRWVKEVIENEKIYEIHSGEELLKNPDFKLQYSCGCGEDQICVYHSSSTPTRTLLERIRAMELEIIMQERMVRARRRDHHPSYTNRENKK